MTIPPRRCGDSRKDEGRNEMSCPKTRGEVWCAVIVYGFGVDPRVC